MKRVRVTLVSDELPKGCGLATYHDNLLYSLKNEGIDVRSASTKRLFGNYPVKVSSKISTRIAHFTDQKSAAVLFFLPFRRYKAVITVHDVTEIINFNNVCRINSLRKKIVYAVWSRIMKGSLKRADAVIADSEHTKKELIRAIGRRKNVTVVYIAADRRFRPYKLNKDPYSILYVGSNLAHKNLKTLIGAFSLLSKDIPQAKLVLVGSSLVGDKDLRSLVRDGGMQKKIVFRGYVDDIQKEYSKAALTVVPSLYEGFGLPVLEAMACGCPVICSDKASLPEVGGDAAIYFDGHDKRDLAKKMDKVLSDKGLQEEMRTKGISQAGKFSWKRCSEETIKVYEKVNSGLKLIDMD